MGILINNIAAINLLYRMGLLRYMEGYGIRLYTVDFALDEVTYIERFLFKTVKKNHNVTVLNLEGEDLSEAYKIKASQNHQISIGTACSIIQCINFDIKFFSSDKRAIQAAKVFGVSHKSVESILDLIIDESIGITNESKLEIAKVFNEIGVKIK
ncbi:hypothetical protein FKX85_06630 [Echinicola soli]|uniref:PIN domain-containing protein n=1 Tax=Echinicola soli TaxID=2591634 RepID=A0A514CFZ8_9BACT|nr:hypothetical protein [Echinicola soli]QDH78728.1 hypothetical protein FKX85_06630 [Echinicola soli]